MNSALRAHLRLSVDHQLPDRQAAASKAGKILIKFALQDRVLSPVQLKGTLHFFWK